MNEIRQLPKITGQICYELFCDVWDLLRARHQDVALLQTAFRDLHEKFYRHGDMSLDVMQRAEGSPELSQFYVKLKEIENSLMENKNKQIFDAIKKMVHEVLKEDNVTGDCGCETSTPKAFAKKKVSEITQLSKSTQFYTNYETFVKNHPDQKLWRLQDKHIFDQYAVNGPIMVQGDTVTVTLPDGSKKTSKLNGQSINEETPPRFTGRPDGNGKGPSGKRYIPPDTILPAFLKPDCFKLLANGNSIILMISPLAMSALGAITRGRTTFEKEEKLPQITRLFKEKMPQMTRGVIKRGIANSRINGQAWIPVNVEITGIDPDSGDIHIKLPRNKDDMKYIQNPLYEQVDKMINDHLLKEGTYKQFKNEVKYRTKSEQLHKAIREVKQKLQDIDRLVEYTSRMKQELSEGEDGVKYWNATSKNIAKINEMVTQLNNKIKNLTQ